MMLFFVFSLFARPTLTVSSDESGAEGYALMRDVVERVGEHSLLSRMGGEGELSATLSDLLGDAQSSLSATVLFRYEEQELQLCLGSEAKTLRKLKEALETRLSSMLLYDGLTLFEAEDALVVDYTYDQGYASLGTLNKGDHYRGLDAQGNRWATTVVRRTFEGEEPVSLVVGTSGKELLPGMRLEKQAGKAVSVSLSKELKEGGHLGLDALYSQEIGLYPFTLVLGGGLDFSSSQLSSLYAQTGFAVRLPLSMVFGLHNGFWRNSSFAITATLGLGYSFVDPDLLFGSSVVLGYRYHLDDWALDIGVGNKHWASDSLSHSSGLFMQLGLAYTW